MLNRVFKSLVFGTVLSLTGFASANAAVYSLGGPTGELPTNTSITRNFTTGAAGTGILAFDLQGYASLDGQNFYQDNLLVTLNGDTVFAGTFDLGGGGSNVVFTPVSGATATTSGVSFFGGGLLSVTTPVAFLNGVNSVVFSYSSVADSEHAGFQGIPDEGWGLKSGAVSSAVPEPSTWAMLLAGLAGLGLMTRKRNRAARA